MGALPQKIQREKAGKMVIATTLSKTKKPYTTYPIGSPQPAIILPKSSKKHRNILSKPGLYKAFR
jgi:hypothetical protein